MSFFRMTLLEGQLLSGVLRVGIPTPFARLGNLILLNPNLCLPGNRPTRRLNLLPPRLHIQPLLPTLRHEDKVSALHRRVAPAKVGVALILTWTRLVAVAPLGTWAGVIYAHAKVRAHDNHLDILTSAPRPQVEKSGTTVFLNIHPHRPS